MLHSVAGTGRSLDEARGEGILCFNYFVPSAKVTLSFYMNFVPI